MSLHPAVDIQMVEAALEEAILLEQTIKPMAIRLAELRDWCKDQGSFSTDRFVVAVTPRTQKRLVSLEQAIEELGVELLNRHNMIQQIHFNIVNIARKA